jgi:hypothetical protein
VSEMASKGSSRAQSIFVPIKDDISDTITTEFVFPLNFINSPPNFYRFKTPPPYIQTKIHNCQTWNFFSCSHKFIKFT